MAETVETARERRTGYGGRFRQVFTHFGKQLRFFLSGGGWKAVLMASVIAVLIGLAIKNSLFITMEGSLIGALVLTFMCIWNGCFNSIQAICRERETIARERSLGMHLTSYAAAHMIFQFMICLVQSVLALCIFKLIGVEIPNSGIVTGSMSVDLTISMLLISYAADMMCLFLSGITRTTTSAVTLIPFVLVFQLIFAGSIIKLPEWSKPIAKTAISGCGIKAVSAQSGYNELPMTTVWNTISSMRHNEIGGTLTLAQITEMLDSPAFEKYRDMEVLRSYTVAEAAEIISGADSSLHIRDKVVVQPMPLSEVFEMILTNPSLESVKETVIINFFGIQPVTVGSLAETMLNSRLIRPALDREVGTTVTLGQVLDILASEGDDADGGRLLNKPVKLGTIIDFLKTNPALQEHKDRTFTFKTTLGDLFEVIGEEKVRQIVEEKTMAASYEPDYVSTKENVLKNWLALAAITALFAILTVAALELIHRKRAKGAISR